MDYIVFGINKFLIDPHWYGVDSTLMTEPTSYSVTRNFVVMWTLLYSGSLIVYFLGAFTTYYLFFVRKTENGENLAHWKYDKEQVKNEIWTSVWSLWIMSGMVTPCEILVMYGYGRVYYSVDEYGWGYLLISPILFLMFTDSLIYWIHRGLHHGSLYFLHKLHHHYKETTPFSAFSFHPIDGFAQGFPYHLFVFFFPMHFILYAVTLGVVGIWTINIHDRMTLRLPGVNGAAHHTIHHTKFNYNYGQYFIFWDWLCGTYMDPLKMWPYDQSEAGREAAGLKPLQKKDE